MGNIREELENSERLVNGNFGGVNYNGEVNGNFGGINTNGRVNGNFGGVNYNGNVGGNFGGINTNGEVNGNFGGINSENLSEINVVTSGNNKSLPVKNGFWSKFKSVLFREIKVELTPYQQKIEDEVNEFLHQEVTWAKVKGLLFKEIKF
ncbi:MAG: hypothetical protein IJV31_05340 [Clostridia bacterium]|nr:hypothetical protein [Clostridia bacterium]